MKFTTIRWRAPAITFGVFAAGMASVAPALAQDFLSNVPMKGVLSTLGIIAPDRDPIEYHERAPLVVPKTMQLPQPAATQASARNPAWPVDPDVARKLKEKAEDAKPVTSASGARMPENAKLTIWSMLGGKSSTPPIEPPGPPSQQPYTSGYMPNGVLRVQGERFAAQNPENEDEIRAGYEPKRKYLTDPPTGYRRPSDKYAFKKQVGAPVKKDDGAHPLDFVKEQADRQKGIYDADKEQ